MAARFIVKRLNGLADEYRSGAPHTVLDEHVEAVIVKTPRNLQDAIAHADPAPPADTTRHNLDRHTTYAVASFLAEGT